MADDPLANLPDPAQRYQVMAISRGPLVYVEIADRQSGQGVVCDALSALEVAADITREVARVMREVVDQEIEALPMVDRLRFLEEEGESLQREIWRRTQN